MRRLLQFPKVLGETGHSGRRVKDNLRPVQSQDAGALGKMPVVADVDADLAELGLKNRVGQVAGREIELLPESRMAVRDVMLAILAQILAVGVDDGGGIEVKPGKVLLEDWNHQHHAMARGFLLHQLDGWAVGYLLGHVVPADMLLRAKVRAIEEFLEAEHLHALLRRRADQLEVLLHHGLLDRGHGVRRSELVVRLDQTTADYPRHMRLRDRAVKL